MLGNAQKQYNHLNLPTIVIFGTTGQIDYIYDATGVKLKKTVTQTTGGTNTTSYAGGYVYLNSTLQFMSQPEGYIDPVAQTSQVKGSSNGTTTYSAYNYIFQYKDHLGNIRLSYADSDKNGAIHTSEIIEESHYYPFGLEQKGYNNVVAGGNDLAQNWKYNGVELNESLGINLYEMDLRLFDPSIGRWNGIDPITHFSMGTSVAFDNNPIFFADPSGADGECFTCLDSNANGTYTSASSGGSGIMNWESREEEEENSSSSSSSSSSSTQSGQSSESSGPDCPKCPIPSWSKLQGAWDLGATWYSTTDGEGNYRYYFKDGSIEETTTTPFMKNIQAPLDLLLLGGSGNFFKLFKSSKTTKPAAKTLVQQADELVKANNNKNSITIGTPTKQIRYDLAGKAHNGVATPHKQIYNKNFFNGEIRSISRASKDAIPLTQAEIRIIRKYIQRLKK